MWRKYENEVRKFSLPPPCAQASHPSYQCSCHVVVVPPLTGNGRYIDSGPCFSFPQQVHPMPLDVLPSPLPSCLQKQDIVQNDPANRSSSCCQRWRCCHPKARSVCQPHGSLIWCTAKPFPPTVKGRMFAMRQLDPSPPGERGNRGGAMAKRRCSSWCRCRFCRWF